MASLLIDGHNLIPNIYGINLSDPDDESQLIRLLQEYCRLRRKKAAVFFDQAPPGMSGDTRFGNVHAYFVPKGRTADDAIIERLKKLGKRARNVTVVSSDHQVQQAARAVHANVMSSGDFAAEWKSLISETPTLDPRNRLLSDDEVAEWEALFKDDPSSSEND
jgi:predicted RNA-binding protein with PIN domain